MMDCLGLVRAAVHLALLVSRSPAHDGSDVAYSLPSLLNVALWVAYGTSFWPNIPLYDV